MPEEKILENPIAVLGDEDLVLGFKALGFKVYPVSDQQEYGIAFERLLNDKITICLMEEKVYQVLMNKISSYKDADLPIIIPFSKSDKAELLEVMLKNISLRAQGVTQDEASAKNH